MNALARFEKKIKKAYNDTLTCSVYDGSIKVEGQVNTWDEVVAIGYKAAKLNYRQVVNEITLFSDFSSQKIHSIEPLTSESNNVESKDFESKRMESEATPKTCDVLIIGAGIIGCAIARELSKYDLKIILVDKEYDVAVHTSSRNDGMIHPGIAGHVGSVKVKMNVRGNALYEQVSKELGVPIRRCGSSILFRSQLSKVLIPFFIIKAKWIGMPGLQIMNKKAVYEREPHLEKGIVWGAFCASAAVTSPYKMTVAYAENAMKNGVELMLNTKVMGMTTEILQDNTPSKKSKVTTKMNTAMAKMNTAMARMNTAMAKINTAATKSNTATTKINAVTTTKGTIYSELVINAAGVYTDQIAQMANDKYYSIHPRKGEIVLLDKKKAHLVDGILGFVSDRSSKNTKGGGVIKTYENNILVGPNAFEVKEREDYSTDRGSVEAMLKNKLPQVKGLSKTDVITYFSGIRAATYKEDFIIEASRKVENLIHVAGIQSPGFASAPAIAEAVEQLVQMHFDHKNNLTTDIHNGFKPQRGPLERKENWNPIRPAIPDLNQMSFEERKIFIKENPNYGEIICRCEEISKGEIIDALKSPIEVNSVDAVKRRVRAGMGRCQGGFCMPLVMEIIHDEKGIPMDQITKKGEASNIAVQMTKEA